MSDWPARPVRAGANPVTWYSPSRQTVEFHQEIEPSQAIDADRWCTGDGLFELSEGQWVRIG